MVFYLAGGALTLSNAFRGNVLDSLLLTPEIYKEMTDIIDDHYLLSIAEERLKNTDEKNHSFEEVLAKDGLTLSDIEAMEDVEIE
jgi:hypothetical protein